MTHLSAVAVLAERFAPPAWKYHARVAGLLHDVGKYQAAFQSYLANDPEASNQAIGTPHAIVGAALAWRAGLHSLPIALAVQAHHGSLKTLGQLEDATAETGTRLLGEAVRNGLPVALLQTSIPELPPDAAQDRYYLALATRFLFSALVDADSLDTEQWDTGRTRETAIATIAELAERMEAACRMKSSEALERADSALNRMRAEVLEQALASALADPGAFTLTVPTGGGKTMSGVAFALRHAAAHGLERVIVVAPYTSILEQMVGVLRNVLGEENVIEHHSNVDVGRETDRARQACENWDAPVIVTTSVQFFESLYADTKKRCRKLHRIGRCVVFLDEVQTFPEHLLRPIHSALDLLAHRFGTSVVHSTATQPRLLMRTKGERSPMVAMREIVPDYARHYPVIADRFRMEVMGDLKVPVSLEELAVLGQHPQVLAILHRRKEAEELAQLLGPDCLHLSGRMCAEHRSAVLGEVRERLRLGQPCRLVATQLVEAGVDIDFPVVYRALAGLETLAQAAGRCNREMRLPNPGRFIVFRAPSRPPAPSLRRGLEEALDFFRKGIPDLSDPELFPNYTRRLLSSLGQDGMDSAGILPLEEQLNFPEVAAKFRMIEDAGTLVVADYGEGWKRVLELRRDGPTRRAFRRLQRFTVSLQPQEIARLTRLGVLEPLLPGAETEKQPTAWALKPGVVGVYSPRFGFRWQGGEKFEPESYLA